MWIQYNKKSPIVNGIVMEIIHRGIEVKKKRRNILPTLLEAQGFEI